MCQACIPQLSATNEDGAQQLDGTAAVEQREMSLLAFAAIILLVLVGCVAVMGLLASLALWLQPQIPVL